MRDMIKITRAREKGAIDIYTPVIEPRYARGRDHGERPFAILRLLLRLEEESRTVLPMTRVTVHARWARL
jgi:hypothetical protein